MPAAAVIPAPLAYIKVVAVKKLVVEFWTGSWARRPSRVGVLRTSVLARFAWSSFACKARCFVT